MTYAQQQDLVNRFGEDELIQLTNIDQPESATIDSRRVTVVLEDADAFINGYLTSRYSLPLATVPPLLVVMACDIARYRLMGNNPTDEARKRYEDALAWLDKVAQGKYGLLTPESQDVPEGDDGPSVVQRGSAEGGRRTFDRERLHDYLRPPRGGFYY